MIQNKERILKFFKTLEGNSAILRTYGTINCAFYINSFELWINGEILNLDGIYNKVKFFHLKMNFNDVYNTKIKSNQIIIYIKPKFTLTITKE